MLNSGVLDVVIGLIFIYLLYSLLATIIQEIIAGMFSFRSKILERAIVRMLEDKIKIGNRFKGVLYLFRNRGNGSDDGSTAQAFYQHPLIKFLGENKISSRPSYITRETFAKVLIDLLRGDKVKPGDDVKSLIQDALSGSQLKWDTGGGSATICPETLSYLNSMWADAQGDVDKFRAYLENWFDQTMERATGWYKKNIQVILFVIGLTIAIVFNVDSIKIAGKLEKDPKLREQLVQQASSFVAAHPELDKEIYQQQEEMAKIRAEIIGSNGISAVPDSLRNKLAEDSANLVKYRKLQAMRDTLLARADSLIKTDIGKANNILGLGLGSFTCPKCDWRCYLSALVGWILTALAISLGAPFWFDLLNKLMKVRNSVANAAVSDKQATPDEKKEKIKTG